MIQCKPTGKRIISLVLCVLMLLSPLASLVDVYAADETPAVMQATTVAAPTSTKGGTSTTVTIVDDEQGAPFWGITSVATATIGDPIEGLIEERSSVILNSSVSEGYANTGHQTSNYFRVNTGWNEFNMKTQDLMFYLELPAGVSEICLRGFTASANDAYKWPAPKGMTYKYLESDSNTWVSGTVSTDGNKTMKLTSGFKGYIRVAVNTAGNCADYAESVVKMVNFDIKIPSYGGDVGAAKLGGVWFVTKEDACLATVNGGTEQKELTTADLPSREPDPEKATWTGSVITGVTMLNETAAVGETATSMKWEQSSNGGTSTPSLTVGEPIAPIGNQKSVIINSTKKEGYASGYTNAEGKTENTLSDFDPKIYTNINPTEQDIMFYIKLPKGSDSVRIRQLFCTASGNIWLNPAGMTYKYLPTGGTEWTTGTISTDGNKQINLTDGFEGYIRLVVSSATNYEEKVTGDYKTKLKVNVFSLQLQKFGAENGTVTFGGVWFVSKEDDTYYIKLDDATDAVSMSGYQAPNYTVGTAAFKETANVGEASAITSWSNPGWNTNAVSTPSMTVGESINILNDGQKSLIINAEESVGYGLSPQLHAKFTVAMGDQQFNMKTQELMLYMELPAEATSIKLYNVYFANGGTLSPYTSGLTYRYLPLNGNAWVDGGTLGDDQQITLTAGFKGYVRVAITDATGWWWQDHGDSGVNSAWKTQTAKMTDIIFSVARFGGDLGEFKLGGVWFVSKDAFTTIKVGDAETNVRMTTWLKPISVMEATTVAKEAEPSLIWNANVSISNGDWLTDEQAEYKTSATASVTDAITKIDTVKSVTVASAKKEGWAAEGQSTYPVFQWRAYSSATINLSTQDLMFYVKLAPTASSVRIKGITVDGWNISFNGGGMTYKALSINSNEWVTGTIPNDNNYTIELGNGFEGYVRLVMSTATDSPWVATGHDSTGWKTKEVSLNCLTFWMSRFGGEYGDFQLGGMWTVTGEDSYMVSVNGGTAVKMTNAEVVTPSETTEATEATEPSESSSSSSGEETPEPTEPSSSSSGEETPEPSERDYLLGTPAFNETAEVGQASASVTTWSESWGATPEPTMTVGEKIATVGTQKSVIFDSAKKEGYFSTGTQNSYAFFSFKFDRDMNPTEQDILFYIELPEAASSIRMWDISCNWYKIFPTTAGISYQYLPIDGTTWVSGTSDSNKQITLTAGFKGYVRLLVNTSPEYADKVTGELTTKLRIDRISFQFAAFGGENGVAKFGGAWFISKEAFTTIKIDNGEVENLLKSGSTQPTEPSSSSGEETPEPTEPSSSSSGEETPEPTEPSSSSSGEETPEPSERDYLLATRPSYEQGNVGETSTLVSLDTDQKWWGTETQATMKATDNITIIDDQKSVVIDSAIQEGYIDSKTSPLFSVTTSWQNFNLAEQDLMFYIELPATGKGYSSIRMGGFCMDSWSKWPSVYSGNVGMDYDYLELTGTAWVSGTADANKELKFPDGFKGYVRLKINTSKTAIDGGWDKGTFAMQYFTFNIGCFGGEKGAAKLGGVWFVSKEAYLKIKIGEADIMNMTKESSVQPTEPSSSSSGEETPEPTEPSSSSSGEENPEPIEPSDRDYLVASRPSYEQGNVGESATQIKVSEDQKWWKIDTKAVTTAADNITIIDDQKSAVISSTIHEGYAYSQTSPLFEVTTSWQNFNMAEQDLMFYIELPVSGKGKSSIRMGGIGMDSWSKWPAVYDSASKTGMTYQYLELNGTQWVTGTADANKQLDFPDGFKGYVRLKLNTAKNAIDGGWANGTFAMQYFTFNVGCFGGDYGDAKFGGVWFVSKENYTKIKIGNAEVKNMTKSTGDRDYLLGTIPNMESGTVGSTSGIVSIDDKGWWGKTSASVSVAEHIAPIGTKAQKTTVFSSDKVEGYLNSASAPAFSVGTSWTTFDMGKQDLMFYIELPATGMGYSSIRMSGITMNSWGFYPSVVGMTYQYLESDGNKWVSGTADSNKEIKLPEGFKGYIRLVLNTAGSTYIPDNKPAIDDWKTASLAMQDFSFFIGAFGGKYGDAKLGGVWFISKEDYLTISVSGGDVEELTTYREKNENALERFRELVESLDEKDLSAAATVDEANTLYASMADEYRAKVTAAELAKLKEYEDALASYRPTFLGVTMKKSGSRVQGLKVGYTVNEALIAKEGYKVVASGAVILDSSLYDGSSVIGKDTVNALAAQGKTCSDGYCAASDIEDMGYRDTYLIRVYVVYEQIGGDGTQFTVWNGNYTDRSGNTAPYMSCYMGDVTSYFFVPLMKKIEG